MDGLVINIDTDSDSSPVRHVRSPYLEDKKTHTPRHRLLESVSARFEQNRRERDEKVQDMLVKQQLEKVHSQFLKRNIVSTYDFERARPVAKAWAQKNGRQQAILTAAQRRRLQEIETVDLRRIPRSRRALSPINISNNADDYSGVCSVVGCGVRFTSVEHHAEHDRGFQHSPCNPLLHMPNARLLEHTLEYLCPKCGDSFQRSVECKEHMVMSDHLSLFDPLSVAAFMCPQCLCLFPEKMRCHNHMEDLQHFNMTYPFADDLANTSNCPRTVPVSLELCRDFAERVKKRNIAFTVSCLECGVVVENAEMMRSHCEDNDESHVLSVSTGGSLVSSAFTVSCLKCGVVVENAEMMRSHCEDNDESHVLSVSTEGSLAEIFAEYLGEHMCDTCLQIFSGNIPSYGIHHCEIGMTGKYVELSCKSFQQFVRQCGITISRTVLASSEPRIISPASGESVCNESRLLHRTNSVTDLVHAASSGQSDSISSSRSPLRPAAYKKRDIVTISSSDEEGPEKVTPSPCKKRKIDPSSTSRLVDEPCASGKLDQKCMSGKLNQTCTSGKLDQSCTSGKLDKTCTSGKLDKTCTSGKLLKSCPSQTDVQDRSDKNKISKNLERIVQTSVQTSSKSGKCFPEAVNDTSETQENVRRTSNKNYWNKDSKKQVSGASSGAAKHKCDISPGRQHSPKKEAFNVDPVHMSTFSTTYPHMSTSPQPSSSNQNPFSSSDKCSSSHTTSFAERLMHKDNSSGVTKYVQHLSKQSSSVGEKHSPEKRSFAPIVWTEDPAQGASSTARPSEGTRDDKQPQSSCDDSRLPFANYVQTGLNANPSPVSSSYRRLPGAVPRAGPGAGSEPKDLDKMKLIVFLDLDNWGGFFRRLPRCLPGKTFVWAFYGAGNPWRPPYNCETYQKLLATGCLHFHDQCGRTKDAADFALCLAVGKMDERLPKTIPFVILSADKGFLEVERQMKMSNRRIVVIDPHAASQHSDDMVYTMIVSVVDNWEKNPSDENQVEDSGVPE